MVAFDVRVVVVVGYAVVFTVARVVCLVVLYTGLVVFRRVVLAVVLCVVIGLVAVWAAPGVSSSRAAACVCVSCADGVGVGAAVLPSTGAMVLSVDAAVLLAEEEGEGDDAASPFPSWPQPVRTRTDASAADNSTRLVLRRL